MQVHYGPPGHRGVTHLVAVGADDYATDTDQAVSRGTLIAGGVFALGVVSGNRTLRGLGAGGALALLLVRAATAKRRPKTFGGGTSAGAGAGTSF
ncbi:MAG: hypothetical protein IT338_17730 [Thermomicrobiales bacterium]|nr:hypothetical protein [Thermomicrobiales bacterium]